MSNIAGALYRVTKIANEMKCSRRMKSVSRQCQFKQTCLQKCLLNIFLSHVSTLTRDTDRAILSLRPSVHDVPGLDENGLTYCHTFYTIR